MGGWFPFSIIPIHFQKCPSIPLNHHLKKSQNLLNLSLQILPKSYPNFSQNPFHSQKIIRQKLRTLRKNTLLNALSSNYNLIQPHTIQLVPIKNSIKSLYLSQKLESSKKITIIWNIFNSNNPFKASPNPLKIKRILHTNH